MEMNVSVSFHCCNQLQCFKQHKFIIWESWQSEAAIGCTGQGAGRAVFFSGRSRGEKCFFCFVLFCFVLLLRTLEPTSIPWLQASFHLQSLQQPFSLSHTASLRPQCLFPSLPFFKGSCDYIKLKGKSRIFSLILKSGISKLNSTHNLNSNCHICHDIVRASWHQDQEYLKVVILPSGQPLAIPKLAAQHLSRSF